jgi:hypothetical protein
VPSRAAGSRQEAAKIIQQSQESVASLSNREVLEMVKANVAPDVITAKIKSSACDFDTTPASLQQLKAEGVPDVVLMAMVMAPKSTAAQGQSSPPVEPPQRLKAKIPNGTSVEVEAPFTVTSQEVRKGDVISFRVVNPVIVDGITIIAPGATATARVVKASRGGHFGRAGRLAWTMQDVTAVDGTRIPLEAGGRLVGDSKAAKVATKMILTGALLTFAAPVVLLYGFKRGDNAILPAGKRFEVFVHGDAEVNTTAPPKQ